MSVTAFQKFSIEYVPEAQVPLDYPSLKKGGFEAVSFRPEEGAELVSERMSYAKAQLTWRNLPFDANLWFADPLSSESIKFGIPTSATTWGNYIVSYVKSLSFAPKILRLNIEFSGKGYPPWRPSTTYHKWDHVYASAIDPLDQRVKNFLFVAMNDGLSGAGTPIWAPKGTVKDNAILWQVDSSEPQPYVYAPGWNFNETVANIVFTGLPGQLIEVQPMGGQQDFNHGAWMKRGARNSPQCYGSQPYLALRDVELEIEDIVNNHYTKEYYEFVPDRRRIHPTIGAFGQGWFYVPSIKVARTHNIFGIRVFPHNNLAPSDYVDYRPFVIP